MRPDFRGVEATGRVLQSVLDISGAGTAVHDGLGSAIRAGIKTESGRQKRQNLNTKNDGIIMGMAEHDNYRVGLEAGKFLGERAKQTWSENIPWVLGLDIEDAGSLVRNRITGAFEGVRETWPELSGERFVRMNTRGLGEKSYELSSEFLLKHPNESSILIAAANDITALGASRAAKQLKREKDVAIVGHDCIPDALNEMKIPGTPFLASVSREVHTYGPRLMQLGRALVRGQHVAPYQYVNHKLVKAEELAGRARDFALVGA
jgi:ribose transport system substrate-binding protein